MALLEAGKNVEEACARVKVGRATISRWAATGREAGADAEHAAFAKRFDDVRTGRNAPPLTRGDLLRLLEKAALKGSVQAMKILLERTREQEGADQPEPGANDPFAALERDELATRRRRRQ